jgi:hypothetical protein
MLPGAQSLVAALQLQLLRGHLVIGSRSFVDCALSLKHRFIYKTGGYKTRLYSVVALYFQFFG